MRKSSREKGQNADPSLGYYRLFVIWGRNIAIFYVYPLQVTVRG